jgi:hypothetical protein
MDSHKIFCSACDRNVQVLITPALNAEGQAVLHDSEVVCLEIGSRCTGNMCPLGATEPNAMVARLVRNGIPLETLSTVTARCPACENEVDMVLYGEGRAACSFCGSAANWVVDHAENT